MAKVSLYDRLTNRRQKNRVASDGLLSDQEALNLGSLFEIKAKPDGSTGINKFGDPVRILNIEGVDADSETVLITIQNETVFLSPTSVAVPGPVTGIVEYGTGSGFAKIEFDIPSPVGGPAPNVQAAPISNNLFVPQKNNVVTLCLPASSIRVFARNDAQIGYLTNFDNTTVNAGAGRNTPAKIRVHAAYGKANMIRERVYRQYFIAGPAAEAASLAVGASIIVGIPAFARRVAFYRNPVQQPLRVTYDTYYQSARTFFIDIPAGDFSFYDLPPHIRGIQVTNTAGNPSRLDGLAAVFELGF